MVLVVLSAIQDVNVGDTEIKQRYEDGELNKVSGTSQARHKCPSVHCAGPLASNEMYLMVLPCSDFQLRVDQLKVSLVDGQVFIHSGAGCCLSWDCLLALLGRSSYAS